MSDFRKVAVIGDRDIVFPLRALGIEVLSPRDVDEAREMLKKIAEENFALCLLEQHYLEPLEEERKVLQKRFCPVVIGFSDYRTLADKLEQMVREMAIRATGSDSLVRRRGKDETR